MHKIVEHKNNIIEILDRNNKQVVFKPTINLDVSKKLLEQFNQLLTSSGKGIYECWKYDQYYIYPGFQNWLYWDFFVPLVQHIEAFHFLRNKKVTFHSLPYYTFGGMERVYRALNHSDSFSKRNFFNLVAGILRWKTKPSEIVISDDGPDGFRYRRLKEEIGGLSSFSRCEPINKNSLLRLLKETKTVPLSKKAIRYSPPPDIDYEGASFLKPYLNRKEFMQLLSAIHRKCFDTITEAKALDRFLSCHSVKHFMGYDQIEETLSWIIACKKHQVPTTTFQHGVLTKYHSGWMGYDIPTKYCNAVPDQLVVWGNYWKNALIKYSNKYNSNNIVVGSHLNKTICYDSFPRKMLKDEKITILIPYEFLADNISLSEYIKAFLDKGWKVIVKIRPQGDGDIDYDTLAYDEEVRDRIQYKYELSKEEIINDVDVVVCTQSTFAYEMMPFNKPIWYLQTPFTMLEDIVEDGIAHSVSLNDIQNMTDKNYLSSFLEPRYDSEKYKSVFTDLPLQDFLKGFLL